MNPIVRIALEEDIGPGDVTTLACVPESQQARGRFLPREPLIVAGLSVLGELYRSVTLHKHDGDRCQDGEVIEEVEGAARALLERERVALNFLQRLSGVATLARQFAEAVEGTGCRVLDTRKTTPGLRALEKAAAAAGGVRNAIEHARSSGLPIEIEVRTRAELHEALEAGAAHLLLDNLTPTEAADWVREIAGRARVELSGGIDLATVRAYAETGADFVSAGAITHSARAMDISFRLELA